MASLPHTNSIKDDLFGPQRSAGRLRYKGDDKVTMRSHEVAVVRKVVVFFDICASTRILEDLVATESQRAWRDLLIALKEFLNAQSGKYGVEVHKFLGDGWVLLFDQDAINGKMLLGFCSALADKYARSFASRIRPRLQAGGYATGLTFGVDRGSLIRITMNGQSEYIGRPLNVAARLQGAIKQKDKAPAGKLLISNAAYIDLGLGRFKRYRVTEVTRLLQNVSFGPSYQARKIVVFKSDAVKAPRPKKI